MASVSDPSPASDPSDPAPWASDDDWSSHSEPESDPESESGNGLLDDASELPSSDCHLLSS